VPAEDLPRRPSERIAVTGALGYSGRYIARRLIDRGERVLTLTGHPGRPNPLGDAVSIVPFNFERPAALARSLEGVETLYNTYWIRFPRGASTYEQAVRNSVTLFEAAKAAGVNRVVHVSIANPSPESPLPYYRGKAAVEAALIGSGMSHGILRPTLLFGGAGPAEDILLNNIAWLLRRLPVFFIPGDGRYRLQPVHVEDVADLAVRLGGEMDNVIMDAAGPEIFTFEELVRRTARAVGRRARVLHAPSALALFGARIVGLFVGDVILTGDEVKGLMEDLLVSKEAPAGRRKLSAWLADNAHSVGVRYASEVRRHFKP
jgi:NADH dehydrogenase